MPNYTHTTLGQFRANLAARLADTDHVFWTAAEKNAAMTEALRVFNCLTGWFRVEVPLTAELGESIYHLNAEQDMFGYRIPTLGSRAVINDVCARLLEPEISVYPAWGVWSGTEMFTAPELEHALRVRRDRFMLDTGCVLSTSTQTVPAAEDNGRVTLASTIVDIRRMTWTDGQTGKIHYLHRSDERVFTGSDSAWIGGGRNGLGTPRAYSVVTSTPTQIQLMPAPSRVGTLTIMAVDITSAINPAIGSTDLAIPDDFVWAVQYGMMADLLSKDGPARDVGRAAYCEDMYKFGVELARASSCVLQIRIQNNPVIPSALSRLDTARLGWQAKTTGTPTAVGLAGYETIALCPVPDGSYELMLDIVRNAVIPLDDNTQYVDVSRELIGAIYDWAEHYLMFKSGGYEFHTSKSLINSMLSQVGTHNERLLASSTYLTEIMGQSVIDETVRPSRASASQSIESDPDERRAGRSPNARRKGNPYAV